MNTGSKNTFQTSRVYPVALRHPPYDHLRVVPARGVEGRRDSRRDVDSTRAERQRLAAQECHHLPQLKGHSHDYQPFSPLFNSVRLLHSIKYLRGAFS